ncbi:MAG: succinate dehydrogenase [Bacteroidetes bacterium HGW-Bacteroidetes-17]|jgi:succinate dehydrogenase / fumarate reductase cytochrome b subunit|nr:MAG: succinate dehydrogenase [Bacteroidetes bacterium HGW-Bacteroidetes-17]
MSYQNAFSSITKKVTTAIAGLFLIMFLMVHLGINLFILPITENHQEMFAAAAHFMGTNWIVKVFEIVLMGAILIHVILGFILQFQNWAARGQQQYKVRSRSTTSFMSRYIIYTGIMILLFLAVHFYNFYFIKLGLVAAPDIANIAHPQEEHFYELAVYLFTNEIGYSVLYIVSFIFLGIHLNHAFQSAFQTLGLNHKKYTPAIKIIGNLYSIIIPIGYMMIPLYFMIYG